MDFSGLFVPYTANGLFLTIYAAPRCYGTMRLARLYMVLYCLFRVLFILEYWQAVNRCFRTVPGVQKGPANGAPVLLL